MCTQCLNLVRACVFFFFLDVVVYFVCLFFACRRGGVGWWGEGRRNKHQCAVVLTKQVGWMRLSCDSDSTTPHCQLLAAEAG